MSFTLRLGLIAAVMTGFLTLMLTTHAAKRASGTEVTIAVEGYDPRDPLLGYYSRIEISLARLDALQMDGEDEFVSGDVIYVSIAADADGVWTANALHRNRPPEGVVIRGYVTGTTGEPFEWTNQVDPETGRTERVRVERDHVWIYVNYNLSRYYASRTTAQELDGILRDASQSPRLILSVQDNGDALIKGLEINGERSFERLW
ncbi:GDYXXLXY domain-containing protein [Maricaulis sp.]|uniref:GDYXXLXY domain-containing protein n=1 Tax=Maricaulis sp. TaxID=1486257 RepID=UPI00262A1A89|nr:GDYXXLXY domain-containing protein [Maricaulis sp.]